MPRLIRHEDGPPVEPIALDAFVAAVDEAGLDARDEGSFIALAPLLARLQANRRFLGDVAIAALEDRCAAQSRDNSYGAQVMMLHRGRGWFLRANLWPAAHDSVMRRSGPAPFFYGVAHDHDFSFLTVGYHGPGYWSDYYDYDHHAVAGHADEPVELCFLERSRLAERRVLLYRAHRDVHVQHPPDALSVSLNIMAGEGGGWRTQYRFDVERGRIAGILGAAPSEALLALATRIGAEPGRALATEVAHGHPCPRMQAAAWIALAGAAETRAAGTELLERGIRDGGAFVRARCAERLAATVGWPERPIRNGADHPPRSPSQTLGWPHGTSMRAARGAVAMGSDRDRPDHADGA